MAMVPGSLSSDAAAGRAAGTPVIVASDGQCLPLARIDLAGLTQSEAWLQQLVFDHPQLLPIADIEPGLGALHPLATEVPCGHGFIDNLYITGSGEIVLVEVKLWRNPQARREVVAQALDYVAALAQMDFEAFEAACRKGSGMAASTLHGLVAERGDALGEAAFVDAVSRNLARGRVLVLVLGDGIRSEAHSLAALLQSHAGAHFTFALVELALWQGPHGAIVALPLTLARTQMIERGVLTIAEGRATIRPPAEVPVRAGTISEELFFEELARRDAALPASLASFLKAVAPLGVSPEFKASLNLKAEVPGCERPVNFGYITRTGKLWTDVLHQSVGATIAQAYNAALAALIGGSVAHLPTGQSYLSADGKAAPRASALLPVHADAWVNAIVQAVAALQTQGHGASDIPAPEPSLAAPAPAPASSSLILSFEEAYEAGLPLVGIVDGKVRSPVMGFIRLPGGFAWCDDGILDPMGSGNPLHPVTGTVVETPSAIRCGHTELRPVDPDDRVVLDHWKAAIAHFGSAAAMHAHAEMHLRTMFA